MELRLLLEITQVICAVFSVLVVTTFSFLATCELMSFCGYGICAWNVEAEESTSKSRKNSIFLNNGFEVTADPVSV